jgi:hypothetical protein
MNVSTTIPQTVQIRRGRLLGLIVGTAALAAATTGAILTLVGNTGNGQVQTTAAAPSAVTSSLSPGESRYVSGISSLTPLERAAAFGGRRGVLDALQLGPKARRYVEGIASLTPVERAAAFGRTASLTPEQTVAVQWARGYANVGHG